MFQEDRDTTRVPAENTNRLGATITSETNNSDRKPHDYLFTDMNKYTTGPIGAQLLCFYMVRPADLPAGLAGTATAATTATLSAAATAATTVPVAAATTAAAEATATSASFTRTGFI